MAVVKPFRELRYDDDVAGPLETLVARAEAFASGFHGALARVLVADAARVARPAEYAARLRDVLTRLGFPHEWT